MDNESLADDYLRRGKSRLRAVGILLEEQSWADVVRESQEIVEITLKALLRIHRIEVPRIHDVSPILSDNRSLFPESIQANIEKITRISKSLRRDLELAFYGSEDLTPSEFYSQEDADQAYKSAAWVHEVVSDAVSDLM